MVNVGTVSFATGIWLVVFLILLLTLTVLSFRGRLKLFDEELPPKRFDGCDTFRNLCLVFSSLITCARLTIGL